MATLGRNIVFPIKNADGTPFENLVLRKAVVDSVVMSLGDKITGDVYYHNNTLAVTMQEYIEYNNVRYYLVNPPTVIREGLAANNSELKGMTKYSFEFYHPMYMLANFPFSDIAVTNDEKKYLSQNKKFSWIGKPQDYIDKINKNLQGTQWIVAKSSRFPIEKDDVLSGVLSFDNNTIADALKVGYDTWDIPYVISQINEEEEYYSDGKRFLVEYGLPSNEVYASVEDKQLDRPFVFQCGQGVGLKNNSRTPKNNKIVTRISGYGSENNIPYGYPQIRWYGAPDAKQTPDGYPIYKGILGGAWVNLIKHPFTRTVLMPTIYRQTLFNKISPYLSDGSVNPNYDPDVEIKDYYDAIATIEYPYVHEINPNAPSYEIHGFDDIKPELGDEQILGATPLNADLTPAESWDDTMDDDGNYLQSYFSITLPQLSFDIYACAAITEEMQINMRGGACIGCTFPIQIDWEDYKANFYDSDGNFVPDGTQRDLNKYPKSNLGSISVICQKEYATFGTIMPNIYQHPAEGDAFVILGISLPESYVTNAETRLDDAMKSYMLENNVYYYEYPLKFDEHFFATHTNILEQIRPNTIVRFIYGNEELALFVKQITIKYGENPLPQYDITLTDDIEVVLNQIGQVEEDVEHLGSLIAIMRETYTRNVWVELAKKLSKSVADTAQGVITFAKGLLFGGGQHGITEDGDANLNNIKMASTQSEGYTGTDIISDKGFKVWEDGEGKSHLITDYFTARVKAFFASLEIRKIEHSAGNRIESPAGNTLALVKRFDEDGHAILDKWYARRYGFGLSWGVKLVFAAGQFFGIWKKGEGNVSFFRCYWTAEDEEAKKAVTNNWKVGDQAFCQTFNLNQLKSTYAENKRYWRLVVGTGYETIEGIEYAYIDLSNVANDVTIVDEEGNEHLCEHGYESGTVDEPEAGDDVACFGNQIDATNRGSAIQYITYDPNAEGSGDGVPCVKMYSGINSFESLDNFVIQKQSPTGVYVRADKFTIYSASGTGLSGSHSTLICYRGDYASDTDYAYGDLVQYHGSSWVCIASSPISNQAPADGSSYWKIYARRGMSTPYIQLDYSDVIVSANSEGRIGSNADIVVKPTKIELYVEGNKVPVSAWNLPSSYVFYYNRTQYFNQSGLQAGVNIGSFTASTDYVTINWQYYPIASGQSYINPIINPTSFAFHIVFTYNGETYVAETSIPMTIQRPGASGANGANGLNSATVFLYQRSSSVPTKPSSTLTYTFSSGLLSGTLGNWTQIIPTSNGNPCYVIQATAVATTSTDAIASSEWSSPTVLVEDGEDGASGAAGYSTATVYLYQRATSAPQTPTSTLTYTFATKALSGTLGNWSQTIPSGTSPLYVTAATAYSNTATDTIASNEWSAAVILAQNGTNGNSVMAEYSATGAANSWHSSFQNGDLYVHYSYDGGSTWTTAIRFVGKSIEFEAGIRHFDTYDDLMDFLVSVVPYMGNDNRYFGYYLTDTDDGGVEEAALWYFFSSSSDPRDIQYVSLPQSGEVNYLTSYDGHLWNAEDGDAAWHDLGAIQGADGTDGISIIIDPAMVIFNQAETPPYGIDTSGFSAIVRVWQGTTLLSGNFIPQNGVSGTNCQASFSGNTVYVNSINYTTDANNQKHYFSSGKVDVTVKVNNQTVVLTLNWAVNLLGEWKMSVRNDTMEAVSSMNVAYYDADGNLQTAALSSAIQQSSQGISLCAKKNDVEAAGIHLNGQNSTINLVAGKVNFIDPNGGSNTKISIDTETGTLHATDGVFEGTLNAKSYLTQFADLETYCYNRPRSGNPNDKGFIPGYHKTMYNAQNESINIEGTWCFRVGASDMPVCLPTNIDGLVGQRVLLYNPHIAYLSFGTNATIINACAIDGDGYDIIYGTEEVIRGIGNPVRSSRDPVLIEYYEPVYEIIFADGVVELQCMPSDVEGSYEWSVVNLGTNVNKLIS